MSPKNAANGTATRRTPKGFTTEERAAMRERAKELKAEAARADGERALRDKIAALVKKAVR